MYNQTLTIRWLDLKQYAPKNLSVAIKNMFWQLVQMYTKTVYYILTATNIHSLR